MMANWLPYASPLVGEAARRTRRLADFHAVDLVWEPTQREAAVAAWVRAHEVGDGDKKSNSSMSREIARDANAHCQPRTMPPQPVIPSDQSRVGGAISRP